MSLTLSPIARRMELEVSLRAWSNTLCPLSKATRKKSPRTRFGNGAKETGSRFLHYSPRMNFGTFVPTTVLTAVGAHSCPAAIAANIAWRNASSALTASERACIAATAAWSFGFFVAWTEVAVSCGHGYALGILCW